MSRTAIALVVTTVAAGAAAQSADEFVPLLDDTLEAWTVENDGRFPVAGRVLTAEGPQGWLKSRRQYGDFELHVEFRFLTEDGDSGVFVRATPDTTFGRGWPSKSYQLQLLNPHRDGRFPPLGNLFRHGMPDDETRFDPAVARRAFTGVGEWQTLTLRVVGDELTAHLNGVPLTEADGIANATGFIGIQGETSALEFRRIDIRELR
jgi:3-keto-disaccharide hydrolase